METMEQNIFKTIAFILLIHPVQTCAVVECSLPSIPAVQTLPLKLVLGNGIGGSWHRIIVFTTKIMTKESN